MSCVLLALLWTGAITVLTQTVLGPGGVTGATLWFKADAGVTQVGGAASAWADQSASADNASQGTAANRPIFVANAVNFNPGLDFDGSADFMNVAGTGGVTATGPLSLFGAGLRQGTGNYDPFLAHPGGEHYDYVFGWGEGLAVAIGSTNAGGAAGFGVAAAGSFAINVPHLASVTRGNGGTNVFNFYGDGGLAGTSTTNLIFKSENQRIGGRTTGIDIFNGIMTEIVAFNTTLPANSLQRIHSYLAIKYGITIPQTTATSYLASDSSTIWDATANAAYNQNIAGIGLDNDSGLNQKQSKSVNAGEVVTIGLGTIAATNVANTNTFAANETFLIWGKDSGEPTLGISVPNTPLHRLQSIWKAQETLETGTVLVRIPQSILPGTSPVLLRSTDATFDNLDTPVTLTAVGANYEASVDFDVAGGYFFTFAADAPLAPGGVAAGLVAWQKANDGVSTSSSWQDSSGNGNTAAQGTVGSQPLLRSGSTADGINFNPAFDFDGTNDFFNYSNALQIGGTVDSSSFVAFRQDAAALMALFGDGTAGPNQFFLGIHTNQIFQVSVGGGPATCNFNATAATALGRPTIGSAVRGSSTMTVRMNGGHAASGACATNFSVEPRRLGARNGNYTNGLISEFAEYNRALTATERQRVESYLAIKNGVTLDQSTPTHYLDSSAAIIWNATTNATHNTNIAGIGRDDASGLVQRQSRSSIAPTSLTIGLGAIDTDNASNPNNFPDDKSFLIWGQDSGPVTLSVPVPSTPLTRLGRVWKAQETGTVGTVAIRFPSQFLVGTQVSLLRSTDATFDGGDTIVPAVLTGGGYYEATIDLASGDFFTFASMPNAPGGVTGNALWLRADIGQSCTTDGCTVTDWFDQSGNSKHAGSTAGTLARTNAGVNFNPVLGFDANEQASGDSLLGTSTFSNANIYIVSKKITIGGPADFLELTAPSGSGERLGIWQPYVDGFWYWDAGSVDANDRLGTAASNITLGVFELKSYNASTTAGQTLGGSIRQGILKNGKSIVTDTNYTTYTGVGSNYTVGGNFISAGAEEIAELIVRTGAVTAVEQQRIHSYLALKYGITLDQSPATNYLDSGGALIWTAATNGVYNKNIAGIGRDDLSALNQKQSQSINTANSGNLVTIGLGTIAVDNASNASTFAADKNFMIWGDNAAGTFVSIVVPGAPTTGVKRMARVWKIQETGTVASVQVRVPLSALQGTSQFLIRSTDPTFATANTFVPLSAGASGYEGTTDFASGEFFTFAAVPPAGPGGVSGMSLWLRGDIGMSCPTNGCAVTQWQDQSGNAKNANVVTGPLSRQNVAVNFNPGLQFGLGKRMSGSSLLGTATHTNANVYFVSKKNTVNAQDADFYELNQTGNPTGGGMGVLQPWYTDNIVYWDAGTNGAVDARRLTAPAGTVTLGRYELKSYNASTTTGQTLTGVNQAISLNGDIITSDTTMTSFTGNNGVYNLGAYVHPNGTVYANQAEDIAELVVTTNPLSFSDHIQIQSYLAVKYGITQLSTAGGAQDYLSSQGTTIWAGAANAGFHNDVAGIGQDDGSALAQKQSASINTGNLVTIGLGTIATDNLSNGNTFGADHSFLVWGRNAGGTTQSVQIPSTTFTRMARIWRTQETGTVGPVLLRIPASALSGSQPQFIRSSDATITDTDTFSLMPLVGSNYEITVDFTGVEFFTFGSILATPGGVSGESLWLRADVGMSCTADGCTVTQWDDQSGNGKDAAVATGTLSRKNVGVNFNPVLGVDPAEHMTGPSVMGTGTYSNANIYIVSKKNDVGFTHDFYELSTAGSTGLGVFQPFTDNVVYWDAGVADATRRLTAPAGTIAFGQFELKTYNASTTANQTFPTPANVRQLISKNGKVITFDTSMTAYTGANNTYALGGHNADAAGESFAEVIVYTSPITAPQQQAIESYLALKYGITLDQTTPRNYIHSGGAAGVIWDATSNATYKNNIAGIGRDDTSALNQRQSKSIHSGEFVTIGLGSIEVDNASNPNSFAADRTFMIWGHDNASSAWTLTLPVTGTPLFRMPRVWKVQETLTAGNVVVRIPATILGGISPTLVRSVNPIFDSTDTVLPMTLNGAFLEATLDFASGDFFTFASQNGPAVRQYGDGYLTDGIIRGAVPSALTPTCNATRFWEHVPIEQRGVYTGGNGGYMHAGFTATESTILADVDNDGKLDIISIFQGNGTYTWLGNGDGTFQTAAVTDLGTWMGLAGGADGNSSTHVGDVNGDGSVDIAFFYDGLGNAANDGTWVWLGNGDGTFQHTPIVDPGVTGGPEFTFFPAGGYTGAESTDLVDVNNDGKLDIVWVYDHGSAANSANGTWVWLGNGDGTWAHTPTESHGLLGGTGFAFSVAGGSTPNESTHLVDIDKDGFVDLVWLYDAALTANSGVRWWKGTGTGTFLTAVNEDLGFQGGPGLAFGAQGGQTGNETTRIVDVNRDGNLDIVWIWDAGANGAQSGTYVYLGNGNGTFNHTPAADVGTFSNTPMLGTAYIQAGYSPNESTLIGDLNGDQVPDILWTSELNGVTNSGTLVWLGNDTDEDGLADIVDTDDDNDGIPDGTDSCNSPGSVSANMQLWLKADEDLTVNASNNAIHWADQTLANRDANYVLGDPQKLEAGVNFNPTVAFDGNDWMRFYQGPFVTGYTAGEVFAVQRSTQGGATVNGQTFDLGNGSRNSHYVYSNDAIYEGFGTTDRFGWNPITKVIVDPKPGVASIAGPAVDPRTYHLFRAHSAANDWAISFDGTVAASTSTNTVSFALGVGDEHIGAVTGFTFTGELAEVILYNRTLTAQERQEVESYLGTKYGITIGHSYLSSNDSTVYWDMAANATYHNNVAGIGRDDNATLNQKQSQSINTANSGNLVTIGLGTLDVSNPLHPSSFSADLSFMHWGDNALSPNFDTLVVPPVGINVNRRMERIWKVQETGTVGLTKLGIPTSIGAGAAVYLVVSNDETFDATDQWLPLSAFPAGSTSYNATDVDFTTGQFFTFATTVIAPGGVSGESLWVKANQGLSVDGSDQVQEWLDQSGSGYVTSELRASHPTHVDPITPTADIVRVANGINFNPAVDFTAASGKSLKGNAVSTWGSDPASIFAVGLTEGTPGGSGAFGALFNALNSWTVDPNSAGLGVDATASGYALDGNGCFAAATASPVTQPRVVRGIYTNPANGLGGSTWLDGVQEATGTNCSTFVSTFFEVGGRTAGAVAFDGRIYNGKIPEVIVYKNLLSAANSLKVDSYLAIKYGITLRQTPTPTNYVDSAGTPIWDAAARGIYKNNIAGIGRDDTSALVQRQSQSVNVASSGNLVAIGLGTIEEDNITNTNNFAVDRTFLTWGDDNGAVTFATPVLAPVGGVGMRMARVWNVQETLTVPTVKVGVPISTGGGTALYLVVSNDATFDAGDVWVPMAPHFGGTTGYLAGDTDFTTGQYFTFAIVLPLDFGDADTTYGTLTTNDGARHAVPGHDAGTNTAPLMLGSLIDVETDGQPTTAADGDDNNGVDDEDGAVFPALVAGQTGNITVNVTNSGPAARLQAWADWNGNGSFADAGEKFATDLAMAVGANTVPVTVPASAPGTVNFRLRLGTQTGIGPIGAALDGEVEDHQVVISQLTDLAITKTDGQASYVPGAAITYTLVVTNLGPSPATGVSIADVVPAAITGVNVSCVASGAASCGANGSSANNVSFTGASIGAGAGNQLTITITGTIAPSTAGPLTNTAIVTEGPGQGDSNAANNTAIDTDTEGAGVADLVIAKTDGQAGYTPGTPITYTVTVTNLGPSNATGFDISDVVPAAITLSGTPTCVPTGSATCGTDATSGNNVSFTGATLDVGAGNSLTLTISGTVSPSATGNLVNTAQLTIPGGSSYTDPNLGNNSAMDTDTQGAPTVDLAITKTDSQTEYVPGAPVTYTLVVTNAGPSTASGFSVSDVLPVEFSNATASCAIVGLGSCGTNASVGNNISFTNASLAPGVVNTMTITITATVSPDTVGPLANTADVTAGAGSSEPNTANNSAIDTDTQGAGLADLQIAKTDGQAGYIAGTAISYTLTVTNNGPSHAPNFDITDAIPVVLTGVNVSCVPTGTASCGANGTVGNNLSFTGASLNAGSANSLTITVTATVDPSFTSGDIVNTAQVTVPVGAVYSDPTLGNNTVTDTDTPLPQQVDLAISKTDSQTSYVPGAPITYTLVVTNGGPSTATDVSITDMVPVEIAGVVASCVPTGTANCGTNATAGNMVSFTNASLLPGAGHSLTITISGIVSPDTTGPLANTATVTKGTNADEFVLANNTAIDTDTEGVGIADLSITKTDGSAVYTPGAAITYQIVVTNSGPSHADSLAIEDVVPPTILGLGVNCVVSSGIGSCGTNGTVGNSVAFNGASLNAGSSLTITLTGTTNPSATGQLINTANILVPVGGTYGDPDASDNSAVDTDTAGAQSVDLVITKDDGQTTYVPGTPITYAVVVSNLGPSTATGFSVTDTVPSAITVSSVACVPTGASNCGSNGSSGNSVLFSNATLVPGQTLNITIAGTVAPNATGPLANTTSVTAGFGAVESVTTNNSATDTDTQAAPQADLSVTKTDSQVTYVAGLPISYAIVVSNAGPSTATGFSIADTVPAAITGVTVTCAVTGTGLCGVDGSSGNAISFTGASLAPGAGNLLTLTISGTVSAAATGSLVNTVNVTPGTGETDPTSTNNAATDTNTAGTAQIDLVVTKDDGQTEYVPGLPVSYTITVTNAGPSAAAGFTLTDTVPASITGVTASCALTGAGACGTNASSGNNVGFTGLSLAPGVGNSLTFTVSGTASPSATGPIANTVTVTAGAGSIDLNGADNSATDTDTQGTSQTDLAITKTDGQTSYVPGTPISYTIVVTNAGPSAASGVSITDSVSSAITGVTVSCVPAGTASCGTNNSSANNVSFINASVLPGAGNQLTLTVSGTVSASATGNLDNTATVTAGAGATDLNAANNSATDTDTQGTAQVDLAITKTDGQTSYVPGTPISYTIVVTNAGPSTASNFSIDDVVPAAITGMSMSCVVTGTGNCGSSAPSGNTIAITGASVAPGAGNALTITVSGTVDSGATGNLVNTATVTAGAGSTDANAANNSATDTDTQGTGSADLVITKTDGQAGYTPGTPISYTVTITNLGPSNATAFDISDVVPAAITNVTVNCVLAGTGSCGTNATTGNNVSFTGASLAAGAGNSLTLTISGDIDPSALGNLVNTAQLTIPGGAGYADPDLANNSATDTDTQGSPTVDLQITKTDGQISYVPGAPLTYTVVVTNLGPSTATGFTVGDLLPVSFSNVTASCAIVGLGSCGSNDTVGNAVSFSNLTLAPGATNTLTFTITGTVSPDTTGPLSNSATVTEGAGATESNPADNSALDVDTQGDGISDLQIAKTDGQAGYIAGTALTYIITVTNLGPSHAPNFTVTDVVPPMLSSVIVGCSTTGTASCGTNGSAGNNVLFTGASLNAGAGNSLTITVTATVDPSFTSGNIVNTAQVDVPVGVGYSDSTLGNNSATDIDTPLPQQVDLVITKTDAQTSYVPGAPVSYTLVVTNLGPSLATDVSIADVVPAFISGATASCVASGVANCGTNASVGNNVSFTNASIWPGVGHSLTITISGIVSPDTTGTLANSATVTKGTGADEPNVGNNTATDSDTQGAGVADLSITKSDGASIFTPGTGITYQIVVSNNGPSHAVGFDMNDVISPDITGVAVTCAVSSGVAACGTNASVGNTVAFTGLSVNAGSALTFTVTGTTNPSASADLVNTATLVVPGGASFGDPNATNDTATDVDTLGSQQVDIQVTKDDAQAAYVSGAPITYTVVVSNLGPSTATGFNVSDAVPASITGVAVSCVASGVSSSCGSNSSTGNNVLYSNATLEPGDTLTLTITGTVAPSATGDIVNTASVVLGAGVVETNPADNSATDTDTQGVSSVDLAVTKTDGQPNYVPGLPISYTMTVTNAGPSTATLFSLADTVPASITGVTVTCAVTGTATCGTNASAGNAISFTDLTLEPGVANQLTFTVSGTVDASATGSLANTVTVTAGAGSTDSAPGNNTATDTDTQATSQIDLKVVKTDGQTSYVPGTPIIYTVTVINAGPSTATSFELMDAVPAAISVASVVCVPTGGTTLCGADVSSGNAIHFTGLSLDPGVPNQLTFTITGTVSSSATGTLTNTAFVVAGAGSVDLIPGDNTSTDIDTQGTSQINLTVTKDDSQTSYVPGTPISYTITVTNAGPSTATAFTLADTVPAAITGVTASCVATGTAACGTNASSGNAVSFTGLSLDAGLGHSLTFTVSGTVSPNATGSLANTVTVAAGAGAADTDPTDNSATDTDTQGTSQIDLTVAKTDGQTSYVPGTPISYTITVTNAGPSTATGFSLSDAVPATITGVTVNCAVTGAASCGINGSAGNIVSFTGLSLEPGVSTNSLTFTVSGTVSPSATGNLVNMVTVAEGAGALDTNPADNQATDTNTQGTSVVDLAITKSDGQASYVPGAPITYIVTVTNAGPSTATGFSVADAVPASITGVTVNCAVSGTGSCGTNASAGNSLSFTNLTLDPGAGNAITFTVSGTVDPAATGDLINTATVTVAAGVTETNLANNTATDTDTQSSQADVQVTKTGPASVVPGTNAVYTITVSNVGPSVASNVTVDDPTPTGLTFVSNTGDCTTAFPCSFATVAPGTVLTITATYAVPQDYTTPTPITNTATVTSPTVDPNGTNNTVTVQTTLGAPLADMQIVKSVSAAPVLAGQTFTYTLQVKNNGPSLATNVVTTDTLPLPLSFVSSAAGCTATGQSVVCPTIASLTVGTTVSFDVVVLLDPSYAGDGSDILNGALVMAATADPLMANNSSPAGAAPVGGSNADLAITKDVSPTPVVPGETFTYTLFVTNQGPSTAVNVVVTDPLPLGVNFVSSAQGCTAVGQQVTCPTIPAMLPGAFATFTLVVQLDPSYTGNGSDIQNRASVSSDTVDPVPANNTSNSATPVVGVPSADVATTKSVLETSIVPGDTFTYRLVVRNNGPSTALAVVASDPLPTQVTFVSSPQACTAVGQTVTCPPIGSLAVGATATFDIIVRLDPAYFGDGSDIVNIATATSPTPDPNPGNNPSPPTLPPSIGVGGAELVIAIAGPSGPVPSGQNVVFTITVTNQGPNTALDVLTQIPLPPGLVLVGVSGACTTLPCPIGTLLPGQVATYQVTYFVPLNVTGVVVVSASVSSSTPDPNMTNNTAAASTPPLAGLSITKTAANTVVAGQSLVYTITVTNEGPSTALATVTDPTPAGLLFISNAGACSVPFPCQVGPLAPGQSLSFTATYFVPASFAAGTVISNTATVSGQVDDPDPTDNTSTGSSTVVDPTDLDTDGMPDVCETQAGLIVGVNDANEDPDGDGQTNLEECLAGSHPRGFFKKYFAEGADNEFFNAFYQVENVDGANASHLLFRAQTDAGVQHRRWFGLPAAGRTTLDGELMLGQALAFATLIESDTAIGAERTMTWTGGGAHGDTAVDAPSMTWYFAEGATHADFQLFYLIQNPGDVDTTVEVTYLMPFSSFVQAYPLPAHTRLTIWVNQIPELQQQDIGVVINSSDAPIIAARSMYRQYEGQLIVAGAAATGVSQPALDWYFAEGATTSFFNMYVLIGNAESVPAEVEITYQLDSGDTITQVETVQPGRRFSVWVNDEHPVLADTNHIAVRVRVTNGVPVVAERAMWWPGPNYSASLFYEGHSSTGATATAPRWTFGAGRSDAEAVTYLLVANFSDTAGQVLVTLNYDDGTASSRIYTMPHTSRLTLDLGLEMPEAFGRTYQIEVRSLGGALPLVAERAFYSPITTGRLWGSGTVILGTPVP